MKNDLDSIIDFELKRLNRSILSIFVVLFFCFTLISIYLKLNEQASVLTVSMNSLKEEIERDLLVENIFKIQAIQKDLNEKTQDSGLEIAIYDNQDMKIGNTAKTDAKEKMAERSGTWVDYLRLTVSFRANLTRGGLNLGTLTVNYKVPFTGLLPYLLLAVAIAIATALFMKLLANRVSLTVRSKIVNPIMILHSSLSDEDSESLNRIAPEVAEIEALKLSLLEARSQMKNLIQQQSLGKIAKQVAHDIRSPLAALSMAITSLNNLPEERRVLIRNAVQRINDIANDLLKKGASDNSNKINETSKTNNKVAVDSSKDMQAQNWNLTNELIAAQVDILVSEKRMQYRNHESLEIDLDLSGSFGAFAKIEVTEFKRLLSNLINNSVESFQKNKGKVQINVKKTSDRIEVIISDNGPGIPQQVLEKLGKVEVTFGKSSHAEGGSGLGFLSAVNSMKMMGGEIKIQSTQNVGTKIVVALPSAETPDWFADKIILPEGCSLISLDDDVSIHQIWAGRLSSLSSKNIDHKKFQSEDVFIDYVQQTKSIADKSIFLIDYELLNQKNTGLEIIEFLEIAKQSILVTSRYEESAIRKKASQLGLKILPKSLAGFVPIQVS